MYSVEVHESACMFANVDNMKDTTESLSICSYYSIPAWSFKWHLFMTMLSTSIIKGSVKCLVYSVEVHESACMFANVENMKDTTESLSKCSYYAFLAWSLKWQLFMAMFSNYHHLGVQWNVSYIMYVSCVHESVHTCMFGNVTMLWMSLLNSPSVYSVMTLLIFDP